VVVTSDLVTLDLTGVVQEADEVALTAATEVLVVATSKRTVAAEEAFPLVVAEVMLLVAVVGHSKLLLENSHTNL